MKVNHLLGILTEREAANEGGCDSCNKPELWHDEKKGAIFLRELVNKKFFQEGIAKRELARRYEVSRNFVIRWTQTPNQDCTVDNRGWKKGKRRKWDAATVNRIIEIRTALEDDPTEPYWGPTAIEYRYRQKHPETAVPPLRTIGKMLQDHGMTTHQAPGTRRGALRYLCYPEHTIYTALGDRVLEADFVGGKYLIGRSAPVHFIGYAFKHPPRLRHFARVQGETTAEFLQHTEAFFDRFEVPDVLKIDNGTAMTGGGVHRRIISRVVEYLLHQHVYPVFAVPRRPATQATIEGSNSVFARKFWNRLEFANLQEVDERLAAFNDKTRAYLRYKRPADAADRTEGFKPKVYFTRQVREQENGKSGVVHILNDEVQLPAEYIKLFVLGEWRLQEEQLLIRLETREGSGEEEVVESKVIKQLNFPIHEASKERCKELLS